MKKILWMVVILLATSQIALANGVGKAIESSKKSFPVVTGKAIESSKKPLPVVTVNLTSGSLLSNIEQIARENGWTRVIWTNKKDYSWASETRVTGTSFEDVVGKIIKGYPLQAVFYQGNHVLVIQPRTI